MLSIVYVIIGITVVHLAIQSRLGKPLYYFFFVLFFHNHDAKLIMRCPIFRDTTIF